MEWVARDFLALAAVILSAIAIILGRKDKQDDNVRRVIDDVDGIKARITKLETQTSLFWSLVEEHMSKLLLHDDYETNIVSFARDTLLMKLRNRTITKDEARELRALLEVDLAHADGVKDFTPAQQIAAVLVIARLDQIANKAA